jgi:hypothetical protein
MHDMLRLSGNLLSFLLAFLLILSPVQGLLASPVLSPEKPDCSRQMPDMPLQAGAQTDLDKTLGDPCRGPGCCDDSGCHGGICCAASAFSIASLLPILPVLSGKDWWERTDSCRIHSSGDFLFRPPRT